MKEFLEEILVGEDDDQGRNNCTNDFHANKTILLDLFGSKMGHGRTELALFGNKKDTRTAHSFVIL